MNPLILPILEIGKNLIDKFVQSPEEKEKAKQSLLEAAQKNELKELEVRMSAIIAEASSSDPWTSRARPTFMYVIYILLLASIPMGVLFAFDADIAGRVVTGFGLWLEAIPNELYTLFGAGYLGYAYVRTKEKQTGAAK